ncbi:PEP-CTERM sorting domain-containing protein [Botrimarina colliarenosi]|nr:PEP-CTERM sorting domain-containing protein [Botrimarina colliarenosi]
MKLQPWRLLAALLMTASPAAAAVTYTFDTDTAGGAFTSCCGGAGVSAAHDGAGGVLLTAGGGWSGQVAEWTLWDNSATDTPSDASVMAEIDAILANGGGVSFDVTVFTDEQVFSAAPGWFEVVFTSNGGGSGFHTETNSVALPTAPGGSATTTVTFPIVNGVGVDNDGVAEYTPGDSYRTFFVGLNNDGAAVQTATVHIDNIRFAALPVPEPGTLCLLAFGAAAVTFRRRR